MGLRPTQGMKNFADIASQLSSRAERSGVEGPAFYPLTLPRPRFEHVFRQSGANGVEGPARCPVLPPSFGGRAGQTFRAQASLQESAAVVHQVPVHYPRLCHQLMRTQWPLLVIDMQHGMPVRRQVVADQHAMTLEIHSLGTHNGRSPAITTMNF